MISQFFRLRTTAYLSKFIPQTQMPQALSRNTGHCSYLQFIRFSIILFLCNCFHFMGMGKGDVTMDQEQNTPQKPQVMIVKSTKNVGLAAGLGFFFGPLGMCYATLKGALIMFLVNIVIGIFTLGFGVFLTWPICAIWAYMAAKKYNEKLYAELG